MAAFAYSISDHTNDIGDWCPWSGALVPEDEAHNEEFTCPAMCADATVEETRS